MKHLLPGIALLLAAACAENGPEIPTIEVGGPTGARLMNGQPRDVWEAYEMAYYDLSKQHRDVLRNIDPQRQNLTGARMSLETIVRRLETMQSLVTPETRSAFDPYLARYRGWHKDVAGNSWGASLTSDLERSDREVKSKFSPERVSLVQPAAPAPAPQAVAVPPASPQVPDDKAVRPEVPARAPAPGPSAPSTAPAPAAGGSPRIYYKAWDRAHDDLIKSFKDKEKKGCAANYKDVIDSLKLLKEQLPVERANKLQIYVDYYSGVHEKTRGFTSMPENTSETDIVNELNVAATVLRKEFNPDK